jgi:dephospho-CoA kinase
MRKEGETMTGFVKVGLTGGIAAGKSTVLRRWQQAGVTGIEADALAHEALLPDTPTWAEVTGLFGREVLKADRTIDRAKLAAIVFGDEPKRLALNRIIHPVVRQRWNDALARLAGNGGVAAVSIPLLYEVGAEKDFDLVVVVACSEQTQLARLAGKGMTETHARARMRAQWPLQSKIDRADFVIWNDGTLATAHQQADIVLARIREDRHAPNQKKQ